MRLKGRKKRKPGKEGWSSAREGDEPGQWTAYRSAAWQVHGRTVALTRNPQPHRLSFSQASRRSVPLLCSLSPHEIWNSPFSCPLLCALVTGMMARVILPRTAVCTHLPTPLPIQDEQIVTPWWVAMNCDVSKGLSIFCSKFSNGW